jgi:uncharacterized membrane protein YjjP (DUF1212 family)
MNKGVTTVLKGLGIIQEIENREKRFGKGFSKARRLNPFNPLSYVALVIVFVIALLCFGFIGMWKEVDSKNPFKWQ